MSKYIKLLIFLMLCVLIIGVVLVARIWGATCQDQLTSCQSVCTSEHNICVSECSGLEEPDYTNCVDLCLATYDQCYGACTTAYNACVSQMDECSTDADCDDGDPSTTDTCSGTPKICANSPITQCVNNDGYCPPGCYRAVDNDCEIECTEDAHCNDGDEATLDICALGYCENAVQDQCSTDADCDDGDPSTKDMCSGTPKQCVYAQMNVCTHDDGYCPVNCYQATDNDCTNECLTDADCDDADETTNDTCENGACVHTEIAGPEEETEEEGDGEENANEDEEGGEEESEEEVTLNAQEIMGIRDPGVDAGLAVLDDIISGKSAGLETVHETITQSAQYPILKIILSLLGAIILLFGGAALFTRTISMSKPVAGAVAVAGVLIMALPLYTLLPAHIMCSKTIDKAEQTYEDTKQAAEDEYDARQKAALEKFLDCEKTAYGKDECEKLYEDLRQKEKAAMADIRDDAKWQAYQQAVKDWSACQDEIKEQEPEGLKEKLKKCQDQYDSETEQAWQDFQNKKKRAREKRDQAIKTEQERKAELERKKKQAEQETQQPPAKVKETPIKQCPAPEEPEPDEAEVSEQELKTQMTFDWWAALSAAVQTFIEDRVGIVISPSVIDTDLARGLVCDKLHSVRIQLLTEMAHYINMSDPETALLEQKYQAIDKLIQIWCK